MRFGVVGNRNVRVETGTMFLGHKLFNWLWRSILLIGLLIAGLLLWFNSYLTTPDSLAAIQSFLSDKIGATVEIKKASGNMIRGLKLKDLAIPNPAAPDQKSVITAPQLLVRYDVRPLLWNKLSLKAVVLRNPQVVLEVDSKHQFILPPYDQKKSIPLGSGQSSLLNWLQQVNLDWQAFDIDNGNLVIQTMDGRSQIRCMGTSCETSVKTAQEGDLAIGQIRISTLELGMWRVSEMHSSMIAGQGGLKFTNFNAKAYSGSITGSFEQQVTDSQFPFTLDLSLSNWNLGQLIAQIAHSPNSISGQLVATTAWRGSLTNSQDLSGKGTFTLTDGQLLQIPLFPFLSKVLKAQQLAQPDYSKCQGDFTFGDDKWTLTSFHLASSLFTLAADGTVNVDGELNLNCRLVCLAELVKSLDPTVTAGFPPQPDGTVAINFHLAGTFAQPVSDLSEKLLSSAAPTSPGRPDAAAVPSAPSPVLSPAK